MYVINNDDLKKQVETLRISLNILFWELQIDIPYDPNDEEEMAIIKKIFRINL